MSDITDYDITETMIIYGGGFVSSLGRLFRQADPHNQAKLKATFPEYWEMHRELAVKTASLRAAAAEAFR